MERPTMLLKTMLLQFGMDLDLSVERDIASLRHRTEHEGFSFLSITLPKLSDALLQGIESGRFSCPTNFSRHGRLPRLLGGFFNRVFDSDGMLLDNVDPYVIRAIRMICDFWKKPKVSCDEHREDAAERKYIKVEEELSLLHTVIKQEDKTLDRISGILWTQVFPEVDPLDLICKHGPGATADKSLPNRRNYFSWWYSRLEPWFPAALHCYPNYGFAVEAAGELGKGKSRFVDYVDEGNEPPVRVVFVPKTLLTPRVIAIEPAPMQYIQQSLLSYMVPRLESHWLVKNSVRFTDQSANQRLACKASKDRSLATLDLSDASDRVHVDLVSRIFMRSGIHDYVMAARSAKAALPSGKVLHLNKFASMGSATCFPIEATVFYTLIQAAMHDQDGRRPTSKSVAGYSRHISVYGDDIIVPVDYTDAVVRKLEAYGLKVNINKSFRASLFRESCGADYYNGEWVRPIYARALAPDDERDWSVSQVESWTSTANQFYEAGMWKITQAIREMLESVLRIPIPRARGNRGPGIYFSSYLYDTDLRYDRNLDAWMQKRIVYSPVKRKDNIDGNAIACFNRWSQSTARSYQRTSSVVGRLASDVRPRDGIHGEYHSGKTSVPSFGLLPELQECDVQTGQSTLESRSVCPRDPNIGAKRAERLAELRLQYGNFMAINKERIEEPHVRRCNDRGFPPRYVSNFAVGSGDSSMGVDSIKLIGLIARSTGIDFQSSVKRGAFKSKRRWVTMFS